MYSIGRNVVSDYVKTTTPNMIIDKESGAVINTDIGQYSAIKAARIEKRRQSEVVDRLSRLERELLEMKADLDSLKGT